MVRDSPIALSADFALSALENIKTDPVSKDKHIFGGLNEHPY